MPSASTSNYVTEALASAGLMSTSHTGAAAQNSPPTVIVWQADGGVGHALEFMYKPVMDTLVDGFSNVPDRATRAARKPRVVHGFGVRKFKTLMARMLPSDQRGRSRDSWPHPLLQDGDVFVWIGPVGSDVPPWRALRERGVRTVYYQTEPFDGCQVAGSASEEIWEFSWHNVDMCAPRLAPGVTLRYVPLGYAEPRMELTHRMCADSHALFKAASAAYNTRIVVRDARSTHIFEQGTCSSGEAAYLTR